MKNFKDLIAKQISREANAPATPTQSPAPVPVAEPERNSGTEMNGHAPAAPVEKPSTPKPLFATAAPKPNPFAATQTVAKTPSTPSKVETVAPNTKTLFGAAKTTGGIPAANPFAKSAASSVAPIAPVAPKPAEINPDKDELAAFEIGGAEEFSHPEQPGEFSKEQVEKIKSLFQMLEDNLNNKDAVANCVRTVISSLQANPNMRSILRPEDLGLMVRGLRTAYGVLSAKKQERKSKRSVDEKEVNEILMGLRDMGLKFGS